MFGWWMVDNGHYACLTLGLALAMVKMSSNIACFFADFLQKCCWWGFEGMQNL